MLCGHSTSDALRILHDELKAQLDEFGNQFMRNNMIHFYLIRLWKSKNLFFNWASLLLLVSSIVSLIVTFVLHQYRDNMILIQIMILIFCLILNCLFAIYDELLKAKEPIFKAQKLLALLSDCFHNQNWNASDYLDLHCPSSQCISMQWTIRDSKIINLPTSLLVEGDVILLRPGQLLPAKTSPLKSYADDLDIPCHFVKDGHYNPSQDCCNINELNAILTCLPLKPEPYIMQETPFLALFRKYLDKNFDVPKFGLDKKWLNIYLFLQRKVVPLFLILMIIINFVRYYYFGNMVGNIYDMLIFLQVECFFPILPLFLPIIWKFLDYYGTAQILVHAETFNNLNHDINNSFYEDHNRVNLHWKILKKIIEILRGKSENFPRILNVAQVLGNVTSVCCVDKKGVLSWPNPTPEKVFFLSRNKKTLPFSNSFLQSHGIDTNGHQHKLKKAESAHCPVTCQVLNLTQDTKNHNGLFFDDHTWKIYMNSLKPLGLSILLNTCNLETMDQYTEFADHVTCMSLKQKEAIPVVNRRCFCELTRQIGFAENAKEIFQTKNVYGIYQHNSNSLSRNESSHTEKYKMPMPNMFCVAVKDLSTNTSQLFSQGMADLLLSMCTDYWDGQSVQPLGDSERKKIADFYHRTSMTSYCTAFSYRPFNDTGFSSTSDFYYEVPENVFLTRNHLENGTSKVEDDKDKLISMPNYHECAGPHLMISENDYELSDHIKMPFKMLTNQIFIGMVTMQYQAKQEVVNLIENLESSCIRFVHFSKENELRSRVFSEKMGLEAGWNCHISLLNDVEEKESCDVPGKIPHWKEQFTKLSSYIKSGSAPHINISGSISHNNLIEKITSDSSVIKDQSFVVKTPILKKANAFPHTSSKARRSKCRKQESRNSKDSVEVKQLIQMNMTESLDKVSNYSTSMSDASSEYSSYMEDVPEIQNRAKLPKGIENIRPHINNIDNVPLQVSLFTDCSTSTTCEMLKILQEYGEVTCCFGSSVNIENFSIFLQADCSISIQPVYPYLCIQKNEITSPSDVYTSPFGLSSYMISLPCSLMFKNASLSSIPKLIAEAQKHCQRISSASHLYLSLEISLVLLQVMDSLFFLPPCLPPQQVIWLSMIVVPVVSLTMMNNPAYTQITHNVQGKKRKLLNQTMLSEIFSFLIRYTPSLAICLLCFAINLNSFCVNTSVNQTINCHFNFGEMIVTNLTTDLGTWNGWTTKYIHFYAICQQFLALQLVVYFVIISYCNIHYLNYFWKIHPKENKLWCCVCPTLLMIQLGWFLTIAFSSDKGSLSSLHQIHLATWFISFFWIIGLLVIHELVKRKQMKIWIRHQKRAKLDFGTKLGMNSPF